MHVGILTIMDNHFLSADKLEVVLKKVYFKVKHIYTFTFKSLKIIVIKIYILEEKKADLTSSSIYLYIYHMHHRTF